MCIHTMYASAGIVPAPNSFSAQGPLMLLEMTVAGVEPNGAVHEGI